MGDDSSWPVLVGAMALLIGIFIGALIATYYQPIGTSSAERTLGTAICDQEYDMDFDYYDWSDDTLHCKPREQQYDGLKVELGGGDR